MKAAKKLIPTILSSANGAQVHAEIQARCAAADKPISALCSESGVSVATIWRMSKHQTVANLKPLIKIEAVLKSWGV